MTEQEEMERILALAPFLIAGVVLAILVTVIILHIRARGPEPVPPHPASWLYNLGIKFFSTFAFVLVLALCGLCVIENLSAGSWQSAGSGGIQRTTTYVRSMVWGVKLVSSTSMKSPSGGEAAGALGILLICAVSMLVLCVEDWLRTFGVPDKKRLLLAILFGYAGVWHLMYGDKASGYIRLGFFCVGCLLILFSIVFGASLLSAGLLIVSILWTREIVRSATSPQAKR